jgi:hypothetical protein
MMVNSTTVAVLGTGSLNRRITPDIPACDR